jgi:hypothetical protein
MEERRNQRREGAGEVVEVVVVTVEEMVVDLDE